MSARVLARGATPLNRGVRKSIARGTTHASFPLNSRYERTRERAQFSAREGTPGRRIRDEARDGLSAAAISLIGSIGVTGVLWAVLRWLG
jgi:hypothetical protein